MNHGPSSVVTFLHWWIQGLQFDAGVVGREAPLHGDSQLVALFRPGRDLSPQRLRVGDPQGQGLACEGIDLDLRDVEPAGMPGGVHPLQAAGDAPGRGGLKTLVQDGGCVRVEMVADQGNARRLRKVYVHQVLQDLGASQFGAARRHFHVPPAPKRRRDHEQVGCAHAPVRVILAAGLPGLGRPGCPHLLMQNLGDFVHTHHRMLGVQGALVGIQDLLHMADKITVRLRLQAPAADFPRLQPVSCRATRTVSRPMLSTTCSATSRSASSCSVHPELPAGAGEQASLINSASPAPSRRRARRG